jgi:CheY-like chemotaxis protein
MPHVLIVDDDCDGSEAVARFLRRAGHQIECVPNGREAMRALLESKPDAVVLDVRMPEMDGLTLLEVLRSYLRWSHLPVIVLSAFITPEQSDRAQELDVEYIFHKGKFSLRQLGAAVDDVTGMTADSH